MFIVHVYDVLVFTVPSHSTAYIPSHDIVTLARYMCGGILMYVLFYLVDRPCSLFVARALSEYFSF